MPTAPKTHKPIKVGKSHTEQIKKKHINVGARARQKRRQYATNSKQWQILRNTHISAHPDNQLCAECLRQGIVKAMTDVDHIDGDSWNNKPDNLQSLCKSCHSIKTAREDGGFGNRKL